MLNRPPARVSRRSGKFGWVIFIIFMLFLFRGAFFKGSKSETVRYPPSPPAVSPSAWHQTPSPPPLGPTRITPPKVATPKVERDDINARNIAVVSERIRLIAQQQQKNTELTLARQRGQTREVQRLQKELEQINRDLASKTLER